MLLTLTIVSLSFFQRPPFVLVFVIGLGVARGAGIWRIALEMMVAMTALQLGYPGGSAFTAARKRCKLRRDEHIMQEDVNSGT